MFAGRFEGNTPEDVGGAGSLTRFTCPLGETTIYVEQFRGDDDLYGQLAKRQQAVDELVEIVVGWLQQELGDSPEFPRLKQFCSEELRRDLINALLCAWRMGDGAAAEGEAFEEEFPLRMLLYFSRRGYIRPKEVPQLQRAVTDPQPEYAARLAQRVIARKIGVPDDQPVPPSLAFLADLERLESSWNKYLGATDMYRRRLAQWKQQNPNATEEQTLKPLDALGQMVLEDVLGLQLGVPSDELSVRLDSGREPVATNGKWDAAAGKVTWSEKLTAGRPLPVLLYAVWAKPLAEAQTTRFGKVILDGDNLLDYVLWYDGLTPQERETWDAFVEGCRPGAGLAERIAGFRFPGEPKQRPAQRKVRNYRAWRNRPRRPSSPASKPARPRRKAGPPRIIPENAGRNQQGFVKQ